MDDSQYILDITRDFLEEIGVTVFVAADGEEGFRVVQEILPDLVLLDVQMPKMNGFVVCEMMRKNEKTRDIPIVLMSAVVDDGSFERHSKLRYHADAYMQKPFMKSELHDFVRRFTSLGIKRLEDVERKTGFLVPSGEDAADVPPEAERAAMRAAEARFTEELGKARAAIKEARSTEARLSAELEALKKEKEQLEDQHYALKKSVEGREEKLEGKLKLATQRFEEIRTEADRLQEQNRELSAQLDASARAMADESTRDLKDQLNQTMESLEALKDENLSLKSRLADHVDSAPLKTRIEEQDRLLEETRSRLTGLEEENKALKAEAEARDEPGEHAKALEDSALLADTLQKRVEALQRDLEAALVAKNEIEEQARSVLEDRASDEDVKALMAELEETREENRQLTERVSEAESKAKWLGEVEEQLKKTQAEMETLSLQHEGSGDEARKEVETLRGELSAAEKRARALEEEKRVLESSAGEMEDLRTAEAEKVERIEELSRELEDLRKLAAEETASRMDLEGRLQEVQQEKSVLEKELEKAGGEREDEEELRGRLSKFEEKLDAETKLRSMAEAEAEKLREEIERAGVEDTRLEELEEEKERLLGRLEEEEKLRGGLEKRIEELSQASTGEALQETDTVLLAERLDDLEETLSKTVREAQTILVQQRERESSLEDSVQSLMTSLDEERDAFRAEREHWKEREKELRDAFEEALLESRRLMGEEVSRLYPMNIPRPSRPLEVMTGQRKYGIAALLGLAAVVVFLAGYLTFSRMDGRPVPPGTSSPATPAVTQPDVQTASRPPAPWINATGPGEDYEDIWRRQTVQAVSEDIMIQATLHTKEELEAALKYTAEKEGWSEERTRKAFKDLAETYNLDSSYYVTVYSKNLKDGYPGYADNFERHIALRDHSGKEVMAVLPRELEGSKFISSRVSSAGKDMNPIYLYEVGLTVSFPRDGFAARPRGLQLVLYDVGAVPMRVLTWDMSTVGSLSTGPALTRERSPS